MLVDQRGEIIDRSDEVPLGGILGRDVARDAVIAARRADCVGEPACDSRITDENGRRFKKTAREDSDLLRWVHEEVKEVSQGSDTFATDGKRFLYSSLRPEAGSAGAITLVTTHRYVLWTLIVLVVAGIGLGLSTQPVGIRLWWLAALIVAVVLSALFAPTFAEAVLNEVFFWSLALVLLVWLVQFLYWALPQTNT